MVLNIVGLTSLITLSLVADKYSIANVSKLGYQISGVIWMAHEYLQQA